MHGEKRHIETAETGHSQTVMNQRFGEYLTSSGLAARCTSKRRLNRQSPHHSHSQCQFHQLKEQHHAAKSKNHRTRSQGRRNAPRRGQACQGRKDQGDQSGPEDPQKQFPERNCGTADRIGSPDGGGASQQCQVVARQQTQSQSRARTNRRGSCWPCRRQGRRIRCFAGQGERTGAGVGRGEGSQDCPECVGAVDGLGGISPPSRSGPGGR